MRSPELGPRSPEVEPEPTTRHVVVAQPPPSLIFELSAKVSFNQEELAMLNATPCIGYEYMADDKLIILTHNRNYSWATIIQELQQVLLRVAQRTGREVSFIDPLGQTVILTPVAASETPEGKAS